MFAQVATGEPLWGVYPAPKNLFLCVEKRPLCVEKEAKSSGFGGFGGSLGVSRLYKGCFCSVSGDKNLNVRLYDSKKIRLRRFLGAKPHCMDV